MAASTALGRRMALFVVLAIVLLSFAAAASLKDRLDLSVGHNEYNIYAWELRHFGAKWLYLLGQAARGEPGQGEQDRNIARFFALNRQITDLERRINDDEAGQARDQLRLAQDERDRLENQVEAAIE